MLYIYVYKVKTYLKLNVIIHTITKPLITNEKLLDVPPSLIPLALFDVSALWVQMCAEIMIGESGILIEPHIYI